MREKLVELLENAKQENINLLNFESEIIADYLLQNGVVVLPCKVGDGFGISQESGIKGVKSNELQR